MNIEEIQPLVEAGLSLERMGIQLGYGTTAIRYWLKKFNLKTKNSGSHIYKEPIETTCSGCSRNYTFTSGNRKGHGLKLCNSCHVNRRRFSLKSKGIEYLGGSCIDCGYNKCTTALQFHHLDPSKKEFTISGKHSLSWLRIKDELDKCVLICANCHAERHYTPVPKGAMDEYTYTPSNMRIKSMAVHGTHSMYTSGCRCEECKIASSLYFKRRRERNSIFACRKLSMEQAQEIRKIYNTEKLSHQKLAKLYNVGTNLIYRILSNKAYKETI